MRLPHTLYGCFFYLLSVLAWADEPPYKIVSAPEVKQMIEQEDVLIINVLTGIEYKQQNIPGSINVPAADIATTEQLPKDKNARIIFYCMGVKCELSNKAAVSAAQRGYTNLMVFKGGIPEWYKFQYPMNVNKKLMNTRVRKLSPKRVQKLLETSTPYIIDVRPYWYTKNTHFIEGSINISLADMDKKEPLLPMERQYLITDAYMRQSISAAKYLRHLGYDVVGVLKGGIARWEKEGFPIIPKENLKVIPLLND